MFDAARFLIAAEHIGVQIDTREVWQGNGPAITGREAPWSIRQPERRLGEPREGVKPSQRFFNTKLPRERPIPKKERASGSSVRQPERRLEKGGKPSQRPPFY
jgi:hypothetical protein